MQRSIRGIVVAVIATSVVAVPGTLAATQHHRRPLPNLTVGGGSGHHVVGHPLAGEDGAGRCGGVFVRCPR